MNDTGNSGKVRTHKNSHDPEGSNRKIVRSETKARDSEYKQNDC